ncbi:MAG: hypothetical protein GYB37_14480 [Algicola sp.]|nr:hypothetical protein [Algicola sp.]
MKRVCSITLSFVMMLVLTHCEDIFEEDISDESITPISPLKNNVLVGNSVTFTWRTLNGADSYNLQVSRSSTSEVILDSLIKKTSLSIPIVPGEYDWRVRGENFAYKSSYSFPIGFSVESTNDLSDQIVFLNTPSNNFYTNDNTVILGWSNLEFADSYNIQVSKIVGNNSSIILQQQGILETEYTLDSSVLEEDALYQWSVKAVNDNSETPYASRTIFLDTKAPDQPVLTSPNDDSVESKAVNFSWDSGMDTGTVQSPLKSLLEIAIDENFTSIVKSYLLDGGSIGKQHDFSDIGEYYWRVKIEDEAGNKSQYSSIRSLSVE